MNSMRLCTAFQLSWRPLLVAVFALTLFSCSDGGDTSPTPDTNVCNVGSNEVDSSIAKDLCGCSSCFCSNDGWVCTGADCEACDCEAMSSCELVCLDGFTKDDSGCESCECAPPPAPCVEGTTQDAPDGCNLCTCDEAGVWVCTNDVCAPECEVGETRPSSDNCNVCTCDTEGQWQCSEDVCPGCTPGEVMPPPDDCCTCSASGEWECTEAPCSQVCSTGETKEKGDGCNSCNCNENNEWVCTEQVCPEGADCPPGKENNCEKKEFYGKNLVTGTCCTYDSPCAIPDGLQKFEDYSACLEAPWQGFDGNPRPSQSTDEGVPADASLPPD